jgi:DnaJ-class molecular chaperone
MPEEKQRCPACDGFGYHEDGSEEGTECEVCHGDGMATPAEIAKWKANQ